jgi:hypothetical protein
MARGLAVSDVVNVQVVIQPLAAPLRNFGSLLILGSSPIIDTNERYREYSTLSEVEDDFGTTLPESLAADLFFSQSPRPSVLYIGRWAQNSTSGVLNGAILTPVQQSIQNWLPIANGAMNITIDGVPVRLSGMNFSAITNLNGVASIIQTALRAAPPGGIGLTGSTVQWNATQERFEVLSGSTGGPDPDTDTLGSSVSWGRLPTAIGDILHSANPTNGSTTTLNGTTITFVSASPTGNEVLIGPDVDTTLENFMTFVQSSTDPQLVKFKYWYDDVNTIYLEAAAPGPGGSALTLASTAGTVSGPTLTGGTGTDISAVAGLSQASGAPPPVNGVVPETLPQAVAIFADMTRDWYGLMVAVTTLPPDSDVITTAEQIEGYDTSRIFGWTYQKTDVLDRTVQSDLPSQFQALKLERTFTFYSQSSPYAVASAFGRAFTVNFEGSNTTITLKFKQEPGIVPETLTESQATTLKSKNCNVYVNYENATAIIQEGVMANGYFFDEVHGTDWLQNRVQTDVYNLLYQSTTKIPQTDEGTHRIINTIEAACVQAVVNGLAAPGVWTAGGFGQLSPGDVLTKGFYVYAPPVATQDQADREARKSVPIQVAIKLAGAVHFVGVIINVNR